MQQTSALYQELIASENHWFETTLVIGDSGRLIDNVGDYITFGGTAILVDTGGPDSGFGESTLMSLQTSHSVFNQNVPVVGSAVSGEIDITMIDPAGNIPKMARLAPYVRVTDGVRVSEWLPKGVYFVDTRYTSHNDNGLNVLTIHGYDSMLMFEEDYPSDDEHDYPMLDTDMVQHIANSIDISVDPRTFERMNRGYMFPLPVGYSSREMLGFIAASYGGNFIISDENQLLLIKLGDLPAETNYLIDAAGDAITFGEDRPESTETYTGSVVSFSNSGEKAISGLTVNGGSGTATVTRTGKNLFGGELTGGIVGSNGSYSSASNRITSYKETLANNTYFASGTYTLSADNLQYCTVLTKNSSGEIVDNFANAWHSLPFTFTLTSAGHLFFTLRKSDNSAISASDFNAQVEVGSQSSAYEPYHGNIYTVQIGQTDHQIDALLGQNSIWANTGTVSVTVETSASEVTRILV